MVTLLKFFVNRPVFTWITTFVVLLIGGFVTYGMRRDAFPEVDFDISTVITFYPGASPSEVEKLVTIPLEKEVKNIDGIKKLHSISTENRSVLIVTLDPDARDPDKVHRDIEKAVDRVNDLPADVEEPSVIQLEASSTPVLNLSVFGDVTQRELHDAADFIADNLELLPGVSSVAKIGYRERKIRVELEPDKINKNFINFRDVIMALRSTNLSIPGGNVKSDGREFLIRTLGEFTDLKDIENAIIRSNDEGQMVRVKDVGRVLDDFEDETVSYKTEGVPSIGLSILKLKSMDAIKLADTVKLEMKRLKTSLPAKIDITTSEDFSYFVKRRLKVLQGNLGIGMVLVLISLLLFLNFRVSFIVTLGIPFSFLAAMIILQSMDVSINLISMFGMVIVIGMLVDDAVVVCENIYNKMESGLPKKEAAIIGTMEVFPAIMASVLTTCAAFSSFLFMSGIMGKFLWEMPVVVLLALFCSLLEVVTVLPGHMADFVKIPGEDSPDLPNDSSNSNPVKEKGWFLSLRGFYLRIVGKALKWRYTVLIGGLFFIALTFFVGMQLWNRFQMFPSGGVEKFFLRVEAEPGTPLEKLSEMFKPLEEELNKLPGIEVHTFVTASGLQQNEPNDPNKKRGSHYGQIEVFLTPPANRERTSGEITEALRKSFEGKHQFKNITFSEMQHGPPQGKPVSYDISGAKYEDIIPAKDEMIKIIQSAETAVDIEDSYEAGKGDLQILVDPVKAAEAGVNVQIAGEIIRAAFSGIESSKFRDGDDEFDILVTLPESYKQSFDVLSDIRVPNNRGNLIPVLKVVKIIEKDGVMALGHAEARRTVTVGSEVKPGTSPKLVHTAIKDQLDALKSKYPNLLIKVSGAASDNQESIESLLMAFLYSAIMIFLILLLTFGNLFQPVMIISCIPIGLMSVIWTFFLHMKPLSFLALIGVVGLAGVVVNNAIVLIVFMNNLRDQGVGNMESILRACSTRFRPIVLTSITTVFGLMPTAYGIGGMDPFLVPMALAMAWGLALGSLMTIFIIPCLQAVLDDFVDLLVKVNENLSVSLGGNEKPFTWILIKPFALCVSFLLALAKREKEQELAV